MSPQVRNGLKQFLLTMVMVATLVLPQPTAWAWQATINGAANISDAANAVTVDTAGNVVAAARTMNIANSQGSDFTVVKLSSTIGTELWRRVVRGTGDSSRRDYSGGEPNSVKADTAGNIVSAGHLFNANTGTDFSVVKLSGATGVELWRYSTSGTNTYESQNDFAWAVAVDSANDVIAVGVLWKGSTGRNFIVVKLSGITGRELWRRIVNGTENESEAFAVTVDAANDVIAAGYTNNSSPRRQDFTVVKLSGSNGTELWRREINGGDVRAVKVDAMGNVIAAGSIAHNVSSQLNTAFAVLKFQGSDGKELWRQEINGSANKEDSAYSVTVDAIGNVAAAGYTQNTGTNKDFTVAKLSGSTGVKLWQRVINGARDDCIGDYACEDVAHAVSFDAQGNVFASGWTENSDANSTLTILKLSKLTGADLWRKTINGAPSSVAFVGTVDANGNPVVAGYTTSPQTSQDGVVVKLRGTDGSDFSSVSGRVLNSSGTGLAAVTMTFTRVAGTGALPASAQTGDNGNWSQTGFEVGTTYRVTPSKTGYFFEPASRTFTSTSANLNFAATVNMYNGTPQTFADNAPHLLKLDGTNTSLKIDVASTRTLAILFEAECSVAARDDTTYVDIDILVDGVVVPPSHATDNALCTSTGDGALHHWVRAGVNVARSVGAGTHTIEVRATLRGFAAGEQWQVDDTSVVVIGVVP